MSADAIFQLKGKTVKDIYMWDYHGYDQGFTLELEDGTCLDIFPTEAHPPQIEVMIDDGPWEDEE